MSGIAINMYQNEPGCLPIILIYQPLFWDVTEILLEIGHPPKGIQPGLGICVKTC